MPNRFILFLLTKKPYQQHHAHRFEQTDRQSAQNSL